MIPGVQDIEVWIGARLPGNYRAFLDANPDDVVASDLVLLYGRGSFIERNETYEVKQHCPGFVTIGDDSGGRQFILPVAGGPVSIVGSGVMRPEYAERVADEFSEWLAAGCPLPEDEETGPAGPLTRVSIYLESRPASLKNLLMIKDRLGLATPIGDLKRSIDAIPCSIADDFTYAKAQRRCAELNAIDPCLGIWLASDPSVQLPVGSGE